MTQDSPPPERPRAEPEIIPPRRDRGRSARRAGAFTDAAGAQRIYVTRLGPLGGVLLLLAVLVLAAVMLVVFLGALVVWIPIIALVVLVAAISRLLGLWRW